MIRMALSIATGLAHLHMEIVGTQGNTIVTIINKCMSNLKLFLYYAYCIL